jgi:hypothetical protein
MLTQTILAIKPLYTRRLVGNGNFNNIKNVQIKSLRFDSQSAGVVKHTASQRIHARELFYILGFFEGDGSLSCYPEKRGNTIYLRMDITIGVHVRDIKLMH